MKIEAQKSQAALEFLTTYAWAFTSILIVLGALYYFGVFDFARFLPQECLFPSQFECSAFSFVGETVNEIRFRLVNNIGETVKVKSFSVTNEDVEPLTCLLPINVVCDDVLQPFPFDWNPGLDCDFTFTGCSGGAFIKGERTNAEITMSYCAIATTGCPSTSDVDHIVKGKIIAIVN